MQGHRLEGRRALVGDLRLRLRGLGCLPDYRGAGSEAGKGATVRRHHEAAQTLVQLLPAALPIGWWLRIRIGEALKGKGQP